MYEWSQSQNSGVLLSVECNDCKSNVVCNSSYVSKCPRRHGAITRKYICCKRPVGSPGCTCRCRQKVHTARCVDYCTLCQTLSTTPGCLKDDHKVNGTRLHAGVWTKSWFESNWRIVKLQFTMPRLSISSCLEDNSTAIVAVRKTSFFRTPAQTVLTYDKSPSIDGLLSENAALRKRAELAQDRERECHIERITSLVQENKALKLQLQECLSFNADLTSKILQFSSLILSSGIIERKQGTQNNTPVQNNADDWNAYQMKMEVQRFDQLRKKQELSADLGENLIQLVWRLWSPQTGMPSELNELREYNNGLEQGLRLARSAAVLVNSGVPLLAQSLFRNNNC